MSKITFITQYTRTPETIRDTNVVEFKKPSLVKESLSYAVDINTIYDNYCKTGKLPLNGQQPIYDENFINYDNLIEAQQAVKEASQYFQNLPTEIRTQYGNSLEKFVSAIHSNDKFLLDKGVLKVSKPQIDPPAAELPLVDSNVNITTPAPSVEPAAAKGATA